VSDTYTKLFSSITESTIVSEPVATRWLWVTMLAMADAGGCVYAAVPGLARRANISLAETEAALATFYAPDPYSRTKEHEGRRIEDIDGGWRLLNHAKYAAIRSEAERTEYKREWDRRNRPSGYERAKGNSPTEVRQESDNSPLQSDAPTTPALTPTPETRRVASQPRVKVDLPDWLPAESWQDWHDYRNTRKGWTPKARQLSIAKLAKLRTKGHDPTAVIEQSIERGWTGLFPVNGDNDAISTRSSATGRKLSAVEQVEHAIRERRDREDRDPPLVAIGGR
jgi:hypothetical protein